MMWYIYKTPIIQNNIKQCILTNVSDYVYKTIRYHNINLVN